MKKGIIVLLLFLSCQVGNAQKHLLDKPFVRIYEDNDALTITGKATDWGYSNGLRLDLFYKPKKDHHGIFNLVNKLAGKNSIATSGWGLMQVMMVPKRTSLIIPEKNDYAYAGSLFAVHTIHSANDIKKINVQSEWIAGLMGPPSFAKESQTFFHHLIKDPLPRGWNYQLPADLLLNYNFKMEKQLSVYKSLLLTGAGEMFLGSMMDGISINMILSNQGRSGYFQGLSSQHFTENRKKLKLVVALKSSVDLILYNALLQGGLFNKESPVNNKNAIPGTSLKRQRVGCSLELFIRTSFRGFSVLFAQKTVSTDFKDYGHHSIGNISICKTL